LGHNFFGETRLELRRGEPEKGSRVPNREPPFRHQELHLRRQAQQAEEIGDRCPILPCPLGDLFVAEFELLHHPVESVSQFNGVEVLPLNVLDKTELQQLIVSKVLDHGRHALEASKPRSTKSALSRDQFVPFSAAAYDQGLDDAIGADRLREL
jgi:hypothetical protein